MDALAYAQFLRTHIDKKAYAHALENLTLLADLSRQKQAILNHLSEAELSTLVDRLPYAQLEIKTILLELKRHHQLKILPHIRQAFVRQLEQNGHPVAEITMASPDIDTEAVAHALGPHSVITTQIDPALIAGLRVTTSYGSYEYSARAYLQKIRDSIAGNQKG